MIVLLPFETNDVDELIAELTDARFLLQWAGPRYTYPLDGAQLRDTLESNSEVHLPQADHDHGLPSYLEA